MTTSASKQTKLNVQQTVLCDVDSLGIATLTLNRPDKHNAFDDKLIARLTTHLNTLALHPEVRCLVLRANGKHFSSGADLNWMRAMAAQTAEQNLQDAKQLANLMHVLDTFPHPTIALVQGCAFGGALGLICCCDVAIAGHDARFCLSEVKLGLIPATIGPYVCRAIGTRQARRYMLTAERIGAPQAKQICLIHEVVDNEEMEARVDHFIQAFLTSSPAALVQAKRLCQHCDGQPIDQPLMDLTSEMIANIRVSEQGQEGLNAFFDKRPARWVTSLPPVGNGKGGERNE